LKLIFKGEVMEKEIILYGILGFFALIFISKFVQSILNFFSSKKKYEDSKSLHNTVNAKVKPYLLSLEKKFENDPNSGKHFDEYVHELVKDKFGTQNEKSVEKAIKKCCADYTGADCKEDFCLEGSGISCKKD